MYSKNQQVIFYLYVDLINVVKIRFIFFVEEECNKKQTVENLNYMHNIFKSRESINFENLNTNSYHII